MNREELINVKGGAINASALNAVMRTFNTIIEVGRIVGTAIKRRIDGKSCKL